ncbi:sensor histidine kinase [Cohnella nanjingensis]|uniref:histidine kinase n=1 Tax=Cohnella nanjingensis TaxID=1387779 RepID=A0A7X0RR20_9BACL|nr:sensor histidine kinase [Cohnella nanjingensis]MBB6671975.1 sensor histidine kinase [Cohnella nanjingensis]
MTFAQGRRRLRSLWPKTLRERLILLLVVVTITPILLIGVTSYHWMYQVQIEKSSLSDQSIVNYERDALDKAFTNLASVSQLLVINGGLGDDVMDYLETEDPLEKTRRFLSIDKSLTNIGYSNPIINAVFFYIPAYESRIQFETAPLKPEWIGTRLEEMPFERFYQANQLSYYGPHPSVLYAHDDLVVSLLRKIEYGVGKHYYVYLETKFNDLVHSPSDNAQGSQRKQILSRADGTILYSDLPDYRAGEPIDDQGGSFKGYEPFVAAGSAGWKLHLLVPTSEYKKEVNLWQNQFFLMAALSFFVTVAAAAYILRMVNRPLRQINHEIARFSYNQTEGPSLRTPLQEFDMLFTSFRKMRENIVELIYEVEQKEKRKAELEVEKLMSQINPHFLHNSLNTIQWLARANGQTEIFNLVKVFSRVLHYNLAKSSMIVTIREELGALQDYIELQNVRYDQRFGVHVDCEPEMLDVPIPRFILQPLVENALYHGLMSEQGCIFVTIKRCEAYRIGIVVSDNGKGIPPDKVAQLLEGGERTKSGLGIGLNYVKKMLEVYYDHEAVMEIVSAIDEGTTITITIPDRILGGEDHD